MLTQLTPSSGEHRAASLTRPNGGEFATEHPAALLTHHTRVDNDAFPRLPSNVAQLDCML